jgi:HEPN domain-containing protein
MVDSKRFMDWIEMAKKDLRGAKILFEHGADNYLVSFHCQQAIEKYLKGFLLKNNNQLVEGHGLVKLCKLCEQYNQGFKGFLKEVAFVNEYYLETRYPADQPLIVTEEDTQECLSITEKIFSFVDKIIQ